MRSKHAKLSAYPSTHRIPCSDFPAPYVPIKISIYIYIHISAQASSFIKTCSPIIMSIKITVINQNSRRSHFLFILSRIISIFIHHHLVFHLIIHHLRVQSPSSHHSITFSIYICHLDFPPKQNYKNQLTSYSLEGTILRALNEVLSHQPTIKKTFLQNPKEDFFSKEGLHLRGFGTWHGQS